MCILLLADFDVVKIKNSKIEVRRARVFIMEGNVEFQR